MYYNLILNRLPQITPNKLKIRTDFRETIKFELLMQDKTIKDEEKVILALNLYYYDISQIKNANLAVNDILWFYKGGKELNSNSKEGEKNKEKQIYNYEFDADYIYSAFMDQYKIDLNSISYLHWWKFKAMFNGLKADNRIIEIMGYRAMDLSKIKDKEERKRYRKLQKLYALPDMRTQEEKESDFARAFL